MLPSGIAGLYILDLLVAVACLMVVGVLVAGVVLYRRSAKGAWDDEISGSGEVPDGTPTIAGAAALPSVSGRLRITVRVFTTHSHAEKFYDDREIGLHTNMFPARRLQMVFPDMGRLSQEPMTMPVEGEALYRIYVFYGTDDKRMVYRRMVRRSGSTPESDARDDAAFVAALMDMLAPETGQPEAHDEDDQR